MIVSYLFFLVLIVGGFCIYVALQSPDFTVTRSATMSAPAENIFNLVNDFHQWAGWSPWAKLDLNAKNMFGSTTSGAGATFEWAGNNKVGQGKMEIIESQPFTHIKIRLDFLKPMKATNTAEYTFQPQGTQTTVTWSMRGHNNFIGKAMNIIMNCEKMVGGQFEQGLANMRAIVEKK